jgi:signal transduction histidine kinase
MGLDQHRFFRRLAHDITGVVGVVSTATGEALKAGAPEDQKLRFREMADRGLRKLERVAEVLRLLTEVSPDASIEKRPVSIAELVSSSHSAARLLEVRRGITVSEAAASDLRAPVDLRLVTFALRELLLNAMAHARANVTVKAHTEGGAVFLDVEDDGKGFASAELPSEVPSANPRGLGTGLSLAADIARLHGGSLEVLPATDGSQRLSRVRLSLPTA